jgi:6-phosphogluconolactonase (cycloisomerase 2 family)
MTLTKSVDSQIRNTRALLSVVLVASWLAACGGGGGGGGTPAPPSQSYTIGGTVSGLTASGLVLQNNGGDNLTVTANMASFTFATKVAGGGAYAVTVMTQPANETCTVTGGSGTVGTSNVTSVSIACTSAATSTFTIGGSVSGLTASGLVLQDNSGDNLTVAANATSFTFATKVAGGGAYAVTVKTQPTNETCTVASGSGTVASSNVTTVKVACTSTTTPAFTIGGSISGLTGSGLELEDNGGDNLMVPAKATSFTFLTKVASGLAYAVTVKTQPSSPAQTCAVTSGSGTVGTGNVTTVSIKCTTAAYTIGGTISGLTGATGVVLQDNGGDNLTVKANATSFTFKTPISAGATYAVTVLTQPSTPTQTCTVTLGSGTVVASNVTNVTIKCATSYLIGGTLSGLTGTGLVLQDNGGDNLTVAAKAATFTFATGLQTGAPYAVTVLTQPKNPTQYCTVSGGTGNVASANVSTVAVSCINVGRFAFVANYQGNPNNTGSVSAFTITPATGSLTAVAGSPFIDDNGAYAVAVDVTGAFAYVANQAAVDVTIFTVDQTSGALTVKGSVGTTGTVGASIAVAPSNQYVYVGGYGTTAGSVYGLVNSPPGTLASVPNAPVVAGNTPLGIAVDPTSSFVFASASSESHLFSYLINGDGSLTAATNSPVSAGSGPQGVAVWPLGTASSGYVYTATSGDLYVHGFSYDSTGNLTQLLTSPYNTYGAGPEGIAIDPQGKYLYSTNYVDGTVSSFSINPANGALTPLTVNPPATGNMNHVATPGPIDVKVDPSGQYVYVANYNDNSISMFSSSAGILTLVNTWATDQNPTSIAIE